MVARGPVGAGDGLRWPEWNGVLGSPSPSYEVLGSPSPSPLPTAAPVPHTVRSPPPPPQPPSPLLSPPTPALPSPNLLHVSRTDPTPPAHSLVHSPSSHRRPCATHGAVTTTATSAAVPTAVSAHSRPPVAKSPPRLPHRPRTHQPAWASFAPRDEGRDTFTSTTAAAAGHGPAVPKVIFKPGCTREPSLLLPSTPCGTKPAEAVLSLCTRASCRRVLSVRCLCALTTRTSGLITALFPCTASGPSKTTVCPRNRRITPGASFSITLLTRLHHPSCAHQA